MQCPPTGAFLDKETKREWNRLVLEGRRLLNDEEDLVGALESFEAALAIHADEKLLRKVEKLRGELTDENDARGKVQTDAGARHPPIIMSGTETESQEVGGDEEQAEKQPEVGQAAGRDSGVDEEEDGKEERVTTGDAAQQEDPLEAWNNHVLEGKALQGLGDLKGALAHFQAAFAIDADEMLAKRIDAVKRKMDSEYLSQQLRDKAMLLGGEGQSAKNNSSSTANESSSGSGGKVVRAPSGNVDLGGMIIRDEIWGKLYDYQQDGVRWLWGIFRGGKGGLLGDDMGLGKTCQISSFLGALFHSGLARRVLILSPVSVLEVWKRELARWAPRVATHLYHGDSAPQKARELAAVEATGGVLLTTYGMVASKASAPLMKVGFDCIVLDEGHKIKNHRSQIALSVRQVQAKVRLLLTGTPVQNNLTELWALFDFVTHGEVLGGHRDFHDDYERAIVAGKDKTATPAEVLAGEESSRALRVVIEPYYLRREKSKAIEAAPLSFNKTPARRPRGENRNGNDEDGEADENDGDHDGGHDGDDRDDRDGKGRGKDACLNPDPKSNRNPSGPGEAETEADTKRAKVAFAPSTPDKSAADQGGRQLARTRTIAQALPRKDDFILWVPLSAAQENLYRSFLSSSQVVAVMRQVEGPLAAINVLRKICSHPLLFTRFEDKADAAARGGGKIAAKARSQGESQGQSTSESQQAAPEDGFAEEAEEFVEDTAPQRSATGAKAGTAAERAAQAEAELAALTSCTMASSVETLLEHSSKLVVLRGLLRRLRDEGHRSLVFSQSVRMLDLIQRLLDQEGHRYVRIDGTVTKTAARQAIIDRYNSDRSLEICLLTTQTGGVGITLTGADRVIIFDSSWNPAVESQAVDRAYRIGQTREVVVYRLITCGTIEEKICQKIIFKGGLMDVAAANGTLASETHHQRRYFSFADLRDVFSLGDTRHSSTQVELEEIHARYRRSYAPDVAEHLQFLEKELHVSGVTDYTLTLSLADERVAAAAAANAPETPGPGTAKKKNRVRSTVKKSAKNTEGPSTTITPDDLANLLRKLELEGAGEGAASGRQGNAANREDVDKRPSPPRRLVNHRNDDDEDDDHAENGGHHHHHHDDGRGGGAREEEDSDDDNMVVKIRRPRRKQEHNEHADDEHADEPTESEPIDLDAPPAEAMECIDLDMDAPAPVSVSFASSTPKRVSLAATPRSKPATPMHASVAASPAVVVTEKHEPLAPAPEASESSPDRSVSAAATSFRHEAREELSSDDDDDDDVEACPSCRAACPYPNVTKCPCFLPEDTMIVYNELIDASTMASLTPLQSLDLLLEALDMCDSDPNLHERIMALAEENGFLHREQ